MNELIKVTQNEKGEQLVSGRELHEFLEVKSKYLDWFNRMIEYGFIENIDFAIINELTQKKEGSRLVNREQINHAIKLSMAKELSMIQRTDKGKQARLYFIECENKLKQVLSTKDSLLLNIINSSNETERALALNKYQNEYVKPLENKIEILTHINKLYTSTEIAKELGMTSAKVLNQILAEKKIQYKVNNTWVLTAKYSNLGYESIKQNVLDNGKVIYDRKFTQEGRDFIVNLLGGKIC